MADNVVKLRVDSNEYEGKIRRASEGIQALGRSLRDAGRTFADADEKQTEFVRELGRMQTVSNTAKGKIGEMSAAFINLKSQYLQMSDAERQSPIGQAMSRSLEQLKSRTIDAKRELESLNRELNETKMPDIGSGGGSLFGGGKLGGMLQVFGGNLMTKAAGWATSFAAELGDAVKQGIELARQGEGIRLAFERLGRGDILDGLREATHGTVTDLELMKAAVKFNDFRLPLEELGTMLAFAQQKAKDTGQSVDYMVDSIVTGLGRKSLMILDNLGLSAAEIKEKMAETGDMTKAVGEIIREQMQKAGDYVETAADRATQATVQQQNKLEELGRTFQPLAEEANTMWNSIKIGALDLIQTAIQPLIDKLTTAGRLRSLMGQMNAGKGGNTRVQDQLATLAGSNHKDTLYNGIIANYNKLIERRWRAINAYNNNHASINTVLMDLSRQTGKKFSSIQAVKEDIQALEAMKREYIEGAKVIMNPVKIDIKTDEAEQSLDSLNKKLKDLQEQRKKAIAAGDTELSKNLLKQINQTKTDIKGLDPNALKTGGTKKTVYAAGTIGAQEQLVSDLTKKWKEADDSMREYYKDQLGYAEQTLTVMKGGFDPTKLKELTGGAPAIDFGADMKRGKNGKWYDATAPVAPSEIKFSDGMQKWLNYMQKQDKVNLSQEMSKIVGGVSGMLSGIEDLGVKLPEGLKDVMSGIQGLISIMTSISTILSAIEAISAADTLIPFARGGVVRAAVGYEVPGNHFSGDMVPALLNSGETVLNRAQSGILAAALEGAGTGNMSFELKASGENLIAVIDRTGKRKGMGELCWWKN